MFSEYKNFSFYWMKHTTCQFHNQIKVTMKVTMKLRSNHHVFRKLFCKD